MPTQAVTGTVELRHFFVTPGVAAAHALSGVAIFAGAASVLKTTPLYLLGSIVPNPTAAAIVLIATAALAIIPYLLREPRRRWFMLLILPQQCLLLMHFVSAIVAVMVGHYHDGYVPSGGSAYSVMTEPIVYFGIGFFVAALLGLLIGLRDRHRAPHLGSIDQFHADVRQLEEQLAVALGERSKLQREIAVIKHDAEATWAAERVESALFREQINDVAYEIVQITRTVPLVCRNY